MADTAIKRERDDFGDDLLASLHETPSGAQKLRVDEDDKSTGKRWTPEQDDALRKAVEEYGQRNWKSIATRVEGRNHAQCLQRWNKVLKPGLVKGHWSYEEDSILERMVLQGCHSWAEVSASIPGRTAKQCRERWRNHLDPSINKAPFTPEEDITIQQAYEQLGNRWTQIAELLPGRTEDAVKMRWKALNPNQKTNAKPGRPRLMPGMNSSKVRTTAPPNPDHAVASSMMAPPAPMQPMYGSYPTPYDTGASMPMGTTPLGVMPMQQHSGYAGSEFPEPSVEPLGDDVHEDVDSKDAAILKELLRSHSNSLLSFTSSRGLGSFADMSPEDLLASGELDEMLKAVSLVNDGSSTASMTSSRAGRSSFLSGPFTDSQSLANALTSMGSQDKHIFQELIDELRASGAAQGGVDGGNAGNRAQAGNAGNDPNLYSFSSSSGRNLLHSLEFGDQRRGVSRGEEIERTSATPNVKESTSELEELLDSDLMRPIHRGKRF